MGRMKNSIGTLLAQRDAKDFQGAWILERNGRYKTRMIAVIRTSWSEPVSESHKVFVMFSPDFIDTQFHGVVDRKVWNRSPERGLKTVKHHGSGLGPNKANRPLAMQSFARQLYQDIQKTTPNLIGIKFYATTDIVRYTFIDRATALEFVSIVNRTDPGAIAFLDEKPTSFEDRIDLSKIDTVVSFRDEKLVGRYYVKDGTLHIAFRHKGSREQSETGDYFYQYGDEHFQYFSIEDFGKETETITEPYSIGVRESSEVDKIFLEAFGNPSHIRRVLQAREAAQEGIRRDFQKITAEKNALIHAIEVCENETEKKQLQEKLSTLQQLFFQRLGYRPDKLMITARFGANSLNTSEKSAQEGADQIFLNWFRTENPDMSDAAIASKFPWLAKMLVQKIVAPKSTRGKKQTYAVMKPLFKPRGISDSPVDQTAKKQNILSNSSDNSDLKNITAAASPRTNHGPAVRDDGVEFKS